MGVVKPNYFPPDIWVEFWGHSHPLGRPQHQQGQGLNLDFFHRRHIVRHRKISYLKLFSDPSRYLCEVLGHPHLHGGPQHQQGQGFILELFHRRHIVRNTLIGQGLILEYIYGRDIVKHNRSFSTGANKEVSTVGNTHIKAFSPFGLVHLPQGTIAS